MYINMERKINLHSSVRSNSAMAIEVVSKMSVVECETSFVKDEPTLQIAREVETYLYSCNHCDFSSALKNSLKVRTRRHNSEKQYKCDQCSYEGNQRTISYSHIRSKHSNLCYHCEECEFKTTQDSQTVKS